MYIKVNKEIILNFEIKLGALFIRKLFEFLRVGKCFTTGLTNLNKN